jgi:hypothetical protein
MLWICVATVGYLASGSLGIVIALAIASIAWTNSNNEDTEEASNQIVKRGVFTEYLLAPVESAAMRASNAITTVVTPSGAFFGKLKNSVLLFGLPGPALYRAWVVIRDSSDTHMGLKGRLARSGWVDHRWADQITQDSRTDEYAELWELIQIFNDDVLPGLRQCIWLLLDILEDDQDDEEVKKDKESLRTRIADGRELVAYIERSLRLATRFLGHGPLGGHTKSLADYEIELSRLGKRAKRGRDLIRKLRLDHTAQVDGTIEVDDLEGKTPVDAALEQAVAAAEGPDPHVRQPKRIAGPEEADLPDDPDAPGSS